jgi:cell division protein FtsB
MRKVKDLVKAFFALTYVKFGLVFVVGIVLIGFVGSNSIWGHYRNKMKISELKKEIEHYDGEYRRDQNLIHQMQSNTKAMEKVARERYFMKTDEEDIFVLSDDQREYQQKHSKDEAAK